MPQEGDSPLPVELSDCLEGHGNFLRNNAYRKLSKQDRAFAPEPNIHIALPTYLSVRGK